MPRIVDHQQRRRDIADAIIPLVAAEGFAAASVRNVARAAGWSTGTVRHYFPSQKDLKDFAADAIIDRLRESILERLPADRTQFTRRELAIRLLETILPFTESQRVDYQLWLELMQYDAHRPQAERSLIWEEQRGLCRNVIAIAAGTPRGREVHELLAELPDPAQERWAGYLHTYIDGLASHVMYLPHLMPVNAAKTQLRDLISEMASSLTLTASIDKKMGPESPPPATPAPPSSR